MISFSPSAEQYYANRYSYLPSLGFPEKRITKIAKLFLSNEIQNFSQENLYASIIPYDILKFTNLNTFSKEPDISISSLLIRKEVDVRDNYSIEHYYEYLGNDKYIVKKYEEKLVAYIVINNEPYLIKRTYDYDKEYTYKNYDIEGCFYYGDFVFYVNEKFCNTNGFKMLLGKEIEGMEKFYSSPNFKIYRLLPSSP